MRPPWARTMGPRLRRTTRYTPVRLVSMTSCQASSPIRSKSVSLVIPALATSTLTGPSASSTAAKARSTVLGIGDVARAPRGDRTVPGSPASSAGGALR